MICMAVLHRGNPEKNAWMVDRFHRQLAICVAKMKRPG
ncbi:unnamed protein product [Ciceribacter selenitireducens ATCC BAA-1503]|uniref:Uncharacterized protein n=1 Tax=Ciceribacter selenitireducens ATCC BAA-1503 TaxID=1336235 RepID=A0A376ABI2_9HYPH|nr:unnamed protein product [Ciceribacter selenitireducens ATCC BAA-1503]